MTARLYAASPLAWAVEHVSLVTARGVERFLPYDYQARLLSDRSPRIVVLKARQTGISQTAAILAAHHALFMPRSCVLVVSRDQGAAGRFLAMVYDVLDGLDDAPEFTKRGAFEAELANGSRILSQPATGKAGRGVTATLVILDEAAFMQHDSRIFRAVSPTLSHGGRLVMISTPDGQSNLFYRVWQGMEPGEWSRHRIHWRDCPLFDQRWYDRERPKYDAASWGAEYDLDFIASGGAAFKPDDVDAMRDGWIGLQPADWRSPAQHRYCSGWDIGQSPDPSVGITVDCIRRPFQVVAYTRLERAPFATIQAAIDARAREYGGTTTVEKNGIGAPVIEALKERVIAFDTTGQSKAAILTALVRFVENRELKCGVEQVLSELKSYEWQDKNIVQDSVMALAIALRGATNVSWLSQSTADGGPESGADGGLDFSEMSDRELYEFFEAKRIGQRA